MKLFFLRNESLPIWFAKYPPLNIHLIYSHMINAEPRFRLWK
jgi:hypothetical protein